MPAASTKHDCPVCDLLLTPTDPAAAVVRPTLCLEQVATLTEQAAFPPRSVRLARFSRGPPVV